jgi:hypothetical protein
VDLTEPADPEWGDHAWADKPWSEENNRAVSRVFDASMNLAEFKASLSQTEPPAGLVRALAGLWWVAKDDWDKAHRVVMNEADKECAWVHAYLHRLEGDLDNAGYWYKQAGKPVASGSLPAEWEAIARSLVEEEGKR